MRGLILALCAFLCIGSAHGQAVNSPLPTGTSGSVYCRIDLTCSVGGNWTFSGADTFSGGINSTATSGYQINGLNGLSTIGSSALGVFGGPFTGASATDSRTQFITGFGAYVFESAAGYPNTQENTGLGMGPCIAMTTGGGATCIGTGAGSGETTQGGFVAIGDTAMRNVWDTGGSIAIGAGAYADGAGVNPNYVIGTNSLLGNAGTITVAGSPHTGDVLSFTFTSAIPCGTVNCVTNSPSTSSYTVTSGDTTNAILAGHIATAINASGGINYTLGDGANEGAHNLYGLIWSVADATNHPTVIKGHFPSSWQITPTYGCVGTCSETVTIAPAFSGGENILIGKSILQYFGATTAAENVIIGHGDAANFVTTASENVFLGNTIAPNLSTGTFNVSSGFSSSNALTTGSQNATYGSYSGYQISTGQKNAIFGDETTAGSACITTGSNNGEFGQGACVPSPTASNQLSIQNIIYGTGNAGTGATVSTGSIGIGQTVPGARLDILGTDTSSGTLAFRVQNSTPTTEFSVSDSGAVVVGGTLKVSGITTGTATNFTCSASDGTQIIQSTPCLSTGGNGSGAEQTASYQPGLLTAVNATIGVYNTFVKASTVDNIVGSAVTFTCASNPTITLYECGTSSTCAGPTTIGTVTVTAAGTRFTGTVNNAAIAAGDSIGWAMTAGTCASIDIAANAQIHAN